MKTLLGTSMIFLSVFVAYQLGGIACSDIVDFGYGESFMELDVQNLTLVHAEIGTARQAECSHSENITVFWKINGRKVPKEKCEKCTIWYENVSKTLSKVYVTPFEIKDFGKYECVNVAGESVIGYFRLIELINKDKPQCLLDIIHAKNPHSTMKAPFCDEKGNFEEIQTEIRDNGKQAYWCVNKFTGRRVSDKTYEMSKLRCAKKGWSPVTGVVILIFLQILFVLFDVFLYVCYREGFIAKFMVLKNEHNYYQYKTVQDSQPAELAK